MSRPPAIAGAGVNEAAAAAGVTSAWAQAISWPAAAQVSSAASTAVTVSHSSWPEPSLPAASSAAGRAAGPATAAVRPGPTPGRARAGLAGRVGGGGGGGGPGGGRRPAGPARRHGQAAGADRLAAVLDGPLEVQVGAVARVVQVVHGDPPRRRVGRQADRFDDLL